MLTKYQAQGRFSVLVTGPQLELAPAYVYVDGKRTDEQRTWRGQKISRLKNCLPMINGEVLADGFIYVTDTDTKVAGEVSPGKIIALDGIVQLRAARGFGLTGTIIGALVPEDELSLELGED